MSERARTDGGAGERGRATLLKRTSDEYRTLLGIPDEGVRRDRLFRLAEKFFFAPENVARRRARLRSLGYDGEESELWARGGIRGPFQVALERIIAWLPDLLSSDGTVPFPGWNALVRDWHRDWCRMAFGTTAHPKVSLDAIMDGGVTSGSSVLQVDPPAGDWVEAWARFQGRADLSPSEVDALLVRVSKKQVRGGVLPLRKAMMGMAENQGTRGDAHATPEPVPEIFREADDVFWRRRMLLRAAEQDS